MRALLREDTMQPTYKAILHGDRLEWDDDVPDSVRLQSHVAVIVTIVNDMSTDIEAHARRMVEALERVAARGGPTAMDDAAEWQRTERSDRPLPGRAQ
jgi:hypothetical protein